MNTNTSLEPRQKTYLKAALFLLPALVFWEAVRAKCVPILANMWQHSEPHSDTAERFWNLSSFLVNYGFQVLALFLGIFLLLELFSRAWAPYRRGAVGAVVWLTNFTVIGGLAALLTLTLIEFPRFLK